MLQIQEITDQKTWDNFLRSGKIVFYPFFQSWNWGEVQKAIGFTVLRVGLFDTTKKSVIGICQIVVIQAKRGNYLHLRHGPVLLSYSQKSLSYFLDELKKIAKQNNASFIRLSPLITEDKIEGGISQFHLIDAPIHRMDAEVCWILDITKPEETLLSEMKKNHRYLIRKASAMQIEIIRSQKASDVEQFLALYKSLSSRKHFVPHSGLKEEMAILGSKDQATLYLAKWDKKIIAGAVIVFLPTMAIYHHAALDDEYRNIPASYLLQWEAILDAKKRNISLYNFWGIAPEGAKNHPWNGLTHFKMGFGGNAMEFMHAKDLPLSVLYWKTNIIEKIIRFKKGY
jgi:peptidoglycan pentaglycine glycine transferase (the first glycine)